MSTAIVYLELGFVGLIFYFGLFIDVFWQACKKISQNHNFIFQFAENFVGNFLCGNWNL